MFGGARRRATSIGVGAARVVVVVILNSVETRLAEGAVAPIARAQHREEDVQGVVAAPVARRVAPRAGVRLVEAVAAADARELARDRLELLRLAVVVAVREDAARANVVLREALLSQEAAEARRAGRAGLVIEPPRPGAAPVLGAAEVVQEARLVVADSGGVGVREQVLERRAVDGVLGDLDHLHEVRPVLDREAVDVERAYGPPVLVVP